MTSIRSSHFVSENVLLSIRLLFCLFGWGLFIIDIVLLGPRELRFLTDLSWVGITLYFTIVVVLSLLERSNGPNYQLPTLLSHLLQLFFITAQVIAPIVTVVFWLLLSEILSEPSSELFRFIMITPHVVNLMMVQTELILSCLTFSLGQIWIFFSAIFAYTFLTYTLKYGADTPFPYPFFDEYMDFQKNPGIAIAGILVLIVAFSLVYVLIWAEILFRERITTTFSKSTKSFEKKDSENLTQVFVED